MSIDIGGMSEEWRVMMSCDEAMTAFLRDISSKVNLEFYKTVLMFTLLYRDCMNQYGWQKLAEAECRELKMPLDDKHISKRVMLKQELIEKIEFCSINNAEVVPEVCNEFVTMYMEARKARPSNIDRTELIDLTRHMCHWMFVNGHTCSKLSII